MSGAVTVVTLPLVAFYFNQVPWMGIMTNLCCRPVYRYCVGTTRITGLTMDNRGRYRCATHGARSGAVI
ncbi:MAG: hypothetical protein HC801_12425 [Nitrospira sp.]|nr:hypothetical protein [Nitrospira sp.]